MEQISIFDIFKIGIGPSSSHTMGPWRAAQRFLRDLQRGYDLHDLTALHVTLFGSLAKTGKGHGTDIAIFLGISGEEPEMVDTVTMWDTIAHIRGAKEISVLGVVTIPFDPDVHLEFAYGESLPYHPNGMRFAANFASGDTFAQEYYSIGGGFIAQENEITAEDDSAKPPYPCDFGDDILRACQRHNLSIAQMVQVNETAWRSSAEIREKALSIWQAMRRCIYRGCHTTGHLPGGLNVVRRASRMNERLLPDVDHDNPREWIAAIQNSPHTFHKVLKWVSCFSLAVNEENASFGRVVTAPTNGAAGVIPAVMMYYLCFHPDVTDDDLVKFLLVAGQIGILFKKGATISAAMGGCQAEIGVSSSMAAAALTECLGGSVEQALMAAEIAMEHHLGLTCDPIGGLVQIPCIERNTMGAIKAITASNIAMGSDPRLAKVSLDQVIKAMWDTAQHMDTKFKETSEGGLAIHIPVNVVEC